MPADKDAPCDSRCLLFFFLFYSWLSLSLYYYILNQRSYDTYQIATHNEYKIIFMNDLCYNENLKNPCKRKVFNLEGDFENAMKT
jgi:hypothetical protein